MKQILILAAAAALCSCNSSKFAIKGNVEGLSGTVYLYDSQEHIVDSTAVENGAFEFKGTVDEPAVRFVVDARGEAPATFSAMVLLEPGVITIANDPENPGRQLVSGTPSNDAHAAYNAAGKALIQEYRSEETTDERHQAIEQEYDELTRKTVEQNTDNLFGAVMLAQQLGYELSGQELLDMIAQFTPEMQQTEVLTTLKQNAEQKIRTDIGQPYIDIEQNNADGQPVSLKSVVENPAVKYTLIDFWASWCGPCMGEVPHLKKTYDAFHKKGFEIYGVSFDQNREDWLEAIKANGMNWIHVSDLNGFDNPAAKAYAIQGIPSNFLLDSEGKIVATNLRGEALYEQVSELLGE